MFKKTTLLCLMSFIGPFATVSPLCLADEEVEIYKAAKSISSLIDVGKHAEAKTETEKFVVEFSGYRKLPEMLYWIAEKYKRVDRFEDAKVLYQQIVKDFPDSPWADKAGFCIARADLMILFMAQDYSAASAALEKLTVDFAEHPDLPEALYWITERYERVDRFEEAKRLYQKINQDYQDNPWVNKAKMGHSRASIKSLIVSRNYNQAKAALDKFIADFAGNPDLPESLYWITERFEREDRFEDAKRNYQQIIQNYPYHQYAKKARLGISRAEVKQLVASQKFGQAKKALGKLIADFKGHPDLAESLYWITERYERVDRFEDVKRNYQQIIQNHPYSPFADRARANLRKLGIAPPVAAQDSNKTDKNLNKTPAETAGQQEIVRELYRTAEKYEEEGKFEEAKHNYQQIAQEYPASSQADDALLDIKRADIHVLIKAGNVNAAERLTDEFAAEFDQHPRTGEKLQLIANQYYEKAEGLRDANKPSDANEYFLKAIGVWTRIINNLQASAADISKAYYFVGMAYQQIGDYKKAIEHYEKVCSNWPDSEYADRAQCGVGSCYEMLVEMGVVSKKKAGPIIEKAYITTVEKYPTSLVADYAALRLGETMLEKGDVAAAKKYYKLFLKYARPTDALIEGVKAKLEKLEARGQ
jgi:TolA-binding protein